MGWPYFNAIHSLVAPPTIEDRRTNAFLYPFRLIFGNNDTNLARLENYTYRTICNLQNIKNTKNRALIKEEILELKALVDKYTAQEWIELFCFFDAHITATSIVSANGKDWPLRLMLNYIRTKALQPFELAGLSNTDINSVVADTVFTNLETSLVMGL